MWQCFVLLLGFSLTQASSQEGETKATEKSATAAAETAAGHSPLRCPVPFDDQAPWQYWYADPENCNRYFVCDKDHSAVRMLCPAGLWWDDITKTCMYVDNFPPKHQADCMQKFRGVGTTRQLKEVFIGRCWDYQLFKNPQLFHSGYKDCDAMFEQFAAIFIGHAPCGVITTSDYRPLVEAAMTYLTPDKHLLWSGVYSLAQGYARYGEVAYTLESTLIGYILNDVTWCGQTNGEGINFDWCPAFASCKDHVMASFWAAASEQFSSQARGVVTILLNGSRTDGPSFRNNSFLSEHDIPELDARSVSLVRAWVVHDLEGPYVESCNSASLRTLESRIRYKGINYECQDNPAAMVHLLCAKQPSYPYCVLVREQAGLSKLTTDNRQPIRLDETNTDEEPTIYLQEQADVKYGYSDEQAETLVIDVGSPEENDPDNDNQDYTGSSRNQAGSYVSRMDGRPVQNSEPLLPPHPQPKPNLYFPPHPQFPPMLPPPPQPAYYQPVFKPLPKPVPYDPRQARSKSVMNEIVHEK